MARTAERKHFWHDPEFECPSQNDCFGKTIKVSDIELALVVVPANVGFEFE